MRTRKKKSISLFSKSSDSINDIIILPSLSHIDYLLIEKIICFEIFLILKENIYSRQGCM
jgi:hypothetical protein